MIPPCIVEKRGLQPKDANSWLDGRPTLPWDYFPLEERRTSPQSCPQ